jgi:hypothetical protein
MSEANDKRMGNLMTDELDSSDMLQSEMTDESDVIGQSSAAGIERWKRRKWPQYVGYGSVGIAASDQGSSAASSGSAINAFGDGHGPSLSHGGSRSGSPKTFKPQKTGRRKQFDGDGAASTSSSDAVVNGDDDRLKSTASNAIVNEKWSGQHEVAETAEQDTFDWSDETARNPSAADEWDRACRDLKCPLGVDCIADTLRDGRPRCRCPLGLTGKRCHRGRCKPGIS